MADGTDDQIRPSLTFFPQKTLAQQQNALEFYFLTFRSSLRFGPYESIQMQSTDRRAKWKCGVEGAEEPLFLCWRYYGGLLGCVTLHFPLCPALGSASLPLSLPYWIQTRKRPSAS